MEIIALIVAIVLAVAWYVCMAIEREIEWQIGTMRERQPDETKNQS